MAVRFLHLRVGTFIEVPTGTSPAVASDISPSSGGGLSLRYARVGIEERQDGGISLPSGGDFH